MDGSAASLNREERTRRLDELTAELARTRITERAADAGVTVVVNGAGELIDVTIDDAVMFGAHPQRIGPGVVTALSRARAVAAQRRSVRITEVLRTGVTSA
jgi:DNA-binding protein YbaB